MYFVHLYSYTMYHSWLKIESMYSGRVYQLKADEFLTIIGSDFTLLKVDNWTTKFLKALIDVIPITF